jgi:serine/threonine protein kinase
MEFCKCNNIVKHIETYYFKEVIYMVIEFMDAGSLTSLISYRNLITEDIMAYIMHEILKGLAVLHSKKQIHRDLKSDNILMSENGDVKIADFGFAVQLTK